MLAYVPTGRGSRVRVAVDGDGPGLLAVHGLGGGGYFFDGCAARLAPGYRFARIDLPGTGGSSSPGALSLAGWISDLADVVAWMGPPVVIVGHSLGTILGLELWRAFPDTVRALIFVGGLPRVRPAIRERLSSRAEAIRRAGIRDWGERVVSGVFAPESLERAPEAAAAFARLFDDQDPSAYLASLEILLGADASDVVPTVRVPTAIISGEADQYAPPSEVAAFARALPSGPTPIVLEQVGHVPFLEAPARFADALRQSLEAVAGADSRR